MELGIESRFALHGNLHKVVIISRRGKLKKPLRVGCTFAQLGFNNQTRGRDHPVKRRVVRLNASFLDSAHGDPRTNRGDSWMIRSTRFTEERFDPVSCESPRRFRGGISMKTVFTTGEAAKVCKVSQQTIIRCFDNGQLKGFRVPGSRFRRIPREALYKFMKDNGIPTEALESGKRKVLLVDDDVELVELIHKVLEEDGRFEMRIATNGFDAGMMVKEYRPDLIVLDVMLPDINGKEVCHRVRADPTLEDVRILCISGMIEEDKIQELKLAGADDFLHKPFDIEELIDRMCGQLELEPSATA